MIIIHEEEDNDMAYADTRAAIVIPLESWMDRECIQPVHFFKRYVETECFDMFHHHTKPDISKFMKSVTKEMWKQFSNEFAYSFGKIPSETTEFVVFGYIDGFTTYFYKCLRYFSHMPSENLRLDLIKYYDFVFKNKNRYWDDDDLDVLQEHIDRLRKLSLVISDGE